MTAKEYINKLRPTLTRHFAPDGCYYSVLGALRLGREVGYGLGAYSDAEIKSIIGGLYSDLLVRNTFGHGEEGVPLSLSEWNAAINAGIQKRRETQMWDEVENILARLDNQEAR